MAQPTSTRRVGPARLEARRQGASGQERREERAAPARDRVGAALRAAVRVEQARRVERLARPGGCDEVEQARVEQLDVGVEQHRDIGGRAPDARVVGGAEAGVVGKLDHLGAPGAGQVGAAVARAGVDHDELRRLGEMTGEGIQEDGEIARRVVEHGDRGEAHPAAASASAARVSRAARSQDRAATCAAPRGGEPRAQRLVARQLEQRVREGARIARRHVAGAVPEGLAQRGQVGHDRGRAADEALEPA